MAAKQLRPEFDALNEQIARVRAYCWRCDPESLADLTGLTVRTIYRVRAGRKVTVDTLRMLCLAKDYGTHDPASENQTAAPLNN